MLRLRPVDASAVCVVLLVVAVFFTGAVSGSGALVCSAANSNSSCATAGRSALGACVASSGASCCPIGSSSFGVVCSSAVYDADASANGTQWSCAADGQQLRCATGFVQSLCVGSQCGGGCLGAIHVARVGCSTTPSLINASRCTWRYGDDVGRRGCVEGIEALTGICVSPINRFCGGASIGISCCALLTELSFTPSISITQSRSPSLSTSATPSASIAPTESATQQPTGSSSRSSTPSEPLTMTPPVTATLSLSWTSSAPLTASRTRLPTPTSAPTVTRSFEATDTLTISIPSRTVPPTRSVSVTPEPVYAVVPMSDFRVEAVHSGNTSLVLQTRHMHWSRSMGAFMPIFMHGSQNFNPFGFNSRQEALLDSATVISASEMLLTFREDHCFEPRGKEIISLDLPSTMFVPRRNLSVGASITVESIDNETREWVGLAIVLITTILLCISLLQGYSGPVLVTILSMQSCVLITQHPCSRSRIAAYTDQVRWFVVPSFTAAAFSDDPHFGSGLVHLVIVVATIATHLLICRRSINARKFFPAVPYFVAVALMQGLCNSAWQSLLQGDNTALRALSFVISVMYLAPLLVYGLMKYEPRGMAFARYPAGHPRVYLNGSFYPEYMRIKFCSMCDMWNRNSLYMTPVNLLFYTASSFLNAFFVTTANRCFAVMGAVLGIHTAHFLFTLYVRPGRSVVINVVLLIPLFVKILLIISILASLDCRGAFPINVHFAEVMVVISLALLAVTSAILVVLGTLERRYRLQTAKELQIQQQHLVQLAEAAAAHSGGDDGSGDGSGGDSPMNVTSTFSDLNLSATARRGLPKRSLPPPRPNPRSPLGARSGATVAVAAAVPSSSPSAANPQDASAASPILRNPLPPLTHFEMRDFVAEDPQAAAARGRIEPRRTGGDAGAFLRIEQEVPEEYNFVNFTFGSPESPQGSRGGSVHGGYNPRDEQQQHQQQAQQLLRDVPPLQLSLAGVVRRDEERESRTVEGNVIVHKRAVRHRRDML